MFEGWPEKFNPFPKLSKLSAFLIGQETPLHMSDHYDATHFTGASAMLDSALDTQPELPFEGGRWSDMGEYLGRE